MKSGVYEILNSVSGKLYIGSSFNVPARFKQHKYELRNNKHKNIHLQRAFNKYGESAFCMFAIEHCNTDSLIEKEQFWIDALKSAKTGYNICPIANSTLGIKLGPCSEERKRKISEANTGRVFTEEHRQKLSESHMGQKYCGRSAEVRQRLSDAAKKRWADPEFKKKTSAAISEALSRRTTPRKGCIPSAETREKLRTSHLGQSPNSGSFKKGRVPWNKGKKGLRRYRREK